MQVVVCNAQCGLEMSKRSIVFIIFHSCALCQKISAIFYKPPDAFDGRIETGRTNFVVMGFGGKGETVRSEVVSDTVVLIIRTYMILGSNGGVLGWNWFGLAGDMAFGRKGG